MENIAFTLENMEYLDRKYPKQYKQFYIYIFLFFFFFIKPSICPQANKLDPPPHPPDPFWHNNHINIYIISLNYKTFE